MDINLAPEWKEFLTSLLSDQNYKNTMGSLNQFITEGKMFYPNSNLIFRAFDACPLEKVKVVILGQDPYHGIGQANGLSFSVNKEVSLPPSLKNIYKELATDLAIDFPESGDLTSWANNGVLLLNSVLTVFPNQPGSHQYIGWQYFTDGVIKLLSEKRKDLVFILWGTYAQKKRVLIDSQKHCVLQSVHPSPLSAYRGFFGNNHFSKANAYLVEHGKQPVDWRIK